MKLPVKTGPSRKDPVNGGEYRVLMDSAGAWLADVRSEHAEQIVAALNASPIEAEGEWAHDYKTLYMELLYAVASKHPGETRHQTALRYIRQRENMPANPAQVSDFNSNRDAGTSALGAAPGVSHGESGHCPKCGKTAGHLKPCLLVDCPVRIDGTVRQSDIEERKP